MLQPHETRVSRTTTRKILRHQAPGKHLYCITSPQPRGELHRVCTQAETNTLWTVPCSYGTTQTAQGPHSDLRKAVMEGLLPSPNLKAVFTSRCVQRGALLLILSNSVLEATNPAALWLCIRLVTRRWDIWWKNMPFPCFVSPVFQAEKAELEVSKQTTPFTSLQAFPLFEGWHGTKASHLPRCSFFTNTSGLLSVFSKVPALNRF